MNGYEYERICAQYLKKIGFRRVSVTKASGDQGIDIIAFKGNKKYGFQCKYYSKPVGNKAVQEAFSGSKYYSCDVPVVITNNTFTKSAYELAYKLGVNLWDQKGEEIGKVELKNTHYEFTILYIGIKLIKFVGSFFAGFFIFCAFIFFVSTKSLNLRLVFFVTVILICWIKLLRIDGGLKTHCKICNNLLNKIGICKEDWNKEFIANEEIKKYINEIEIEKSKLSWLERVCCDQIEIAFCNEYNSRIDDFYNANPNLEINQNNYISIIGNNDEQDEKGAKTSSIPLISSDLFHPLRMQNIERIEKYIKLIFFPVIWLINRIKLILNFKKYKSRTDNYLIDSNNLVENDDIDESSFDNENE